VNHTAEIKAGPTSSKHNLIAVIMLVHRNDSIAPPMRLLYRR
jgi:hypothetical protein